MKEDQGTEYVARHAKLVNSPSHIEKKEKSPSTSSLPLQKVQDTDDKPYTTVLVVKPPSPSGLRVEVQS